MLDAWAREKAAWDTERSLLENEIVAYRRYKDMIVSLEREKIELQNDCNNLVNVLKKERAELDAERAEKRMRASASASREEESMTLNWQQVEFLMQNMPESKWLEENDKCVSICRKHKYVELGVCCPTAKRHRAWYE